MQHEMEIWLDNHFSPAIAKWLSESLNISVKSAFILKLQNLSDLEIFQLAKKAGNVIIISKDTDLDNLISVFGSPPQLILVKTGNCDNKEMFEFLNKHLPQALKLLIDFKKDIIELY